MKNKTLAIFSLLVIILAIAIAAYTIANTKPAGIGVWQIAAEISNTGKRDTTEFEMSNPWRIMWRMDNYTLPMFLVSAYMKNGSKYSVVAEADFSDENSTTGILPVKYSGSFVVRVVTMDDTTWTLQIQQFSVPA